MNYQRAFTLIELLIVIAVFLVVAAVAGGIISSTLRGSEKTQTLDQVRQNGNQAITVMAKMIRNAKSLTYAPGCPPPSPTPTPTNTNSVVIVSQYDTVTIFSCDQTTISSNSGSFLNTNAVALKTCEFSCTPSITQPPTIKIKFTLTEAGTQTFVEKKSTVDFETTVTLRNK